MPGRSSLRVASNSALFGLVLGDTPRFRSCSAILCLRPWMAETRAFCREGGLVFCGLFGWLRFILEGSAFTTGNLFGFVVATGADSGMATSTTPAGVSVLGGAAGSSFAATTWGSPGVVAKSFSAARGAGAVVDSASDGVGAAGAAAAGGGGREGAD